MRECTSRWKTSPRSRRCRILSRKSQSQTLLSRRSRRTVSRRAPPRSTRPQLSPAATRFCGTVCFDPMLIREYKESDLAALRRMHARQGFDYAFPDLADPIFVSKLVVEDDAGRAVMASLARITCEMYLLADPGAGNPLE